MRKYIVILLIISLSLTACSSRLEVIPAVESNNASSVVVDSTSVAETESTADEAAEVVNAEEEAAEDEVAEENPALVENADEPAVVRIGWTGSPDTLNPGMTELAQTNSLLELVYDSMYQAELDGTYTLELAERVDITADGLVYTFTIHDDVTFHDGEPLTAADIAFSYNLYATQAEFPLLPSYTGFFESVEAVDETTLVLTLTESIPNLESQLINLWVLPEHIWGALSETAVAEFPNKEMIGSGPFRLLEHAPDRYIRLGAVDDHFLQSPQVDEVIFQRFAGGDALVEGLRSGRMDMITELPNTAVDSLRNDENINLAIGASLSPSVTDIILNQIDPEDCPEDVGGVCSGHPALRDRDVRLALSHATDKQQIIDDILLGLGTPGRTLIPDANGVFYNHTLADYSYDPALANQILDDAGYLDTDEDGIREMPDGTMPLNFRVYWDQDEIDYPRLAELIGEMWAEIGVGTELQGLDVDALLGACCPTFDYDVIVWGWFGDPDPNFLLSIMLSDEISSGFNETGYANPVYDELFGRQATELDKSARVDLIWEMQRTVHEDITYIIPYYPQTVQAYRTDRFTGWQADADRIVLESLHSLLVVTPVE